MKIINRDGHVLSTRLQCEISDHLVILSHSFKGDKDYDRNLVRLADKLNEKGYATLAFDFYGWGKSDGTPMDSTITSMVHDLEDVISDMQRKYKNIILAGNSLGAVVSILCAKAASGLILLSPPLDLSILYHQHFPHCGNNDFAIVTRRRTGEKVKVEKTLIEEFGTIDALKNKISCPAIIIFCENDKYYDPKLINLFSANNSAKTDIQIIPGGDHSYLDEASEAESIQVAIDWLSRMTNPDT